MAKDADPNILNDTESRILQAAQQEFMAKGFAGARTTSIAERAGVTHAMFHYYFRTKEKLFDRIISEKMDMLKNIILESMADISLPLDSMICNLINRHLDFMSNNPELPRFLIGEVFSNPERFAVFSQKILEVAPTVIRTLQQKIDCAAANGECREVDAGMLIIDIFSLNVFPFIATPLINVVFHDRMNNPDFFIEKRKQENYDTIMRKLQPDCTVAP